jgi:hypothetical protein
MNTADIQKQCEAFLKSINVPAFIVLGFQSDPENVQMVYSVKDIPLKSVVKGVTHMLNDIIGKL